MNYDSEILTRLKLARLEDHLKQHRRGLVWDRVRGWIVPVACLGMALYAVWEVVR